MRHLPVILLSVLFPIGISSAPGATSEREVILTLQDGRQVRTLLREVKNQGAYYVENGTRQFVARTEIKMFTFPVLEAPVVAPAPASTAAKTNASSERKPAAKARGAADKGVETKDAELASLLSAPVTDLNLKEVLSRPDVRAMFAMMQEKFLAQQGGDPNAEAARKKSAELYDQLATGKLGLAGLTALGKATLQEADGYAKERQEAPQFEPLIAQLRSLVEAP